MRLFKGFHNRGAVRTQSRTNRRSAVHFLDLESLEDRTVLSSITPTTFADGGAGSGSLRTAIIADNADPGTATDTITLKSGTYSLTLQNPGGVQENAAATGDLDITSTAHTLIIKGQGTSGPSATIIDASTLLDRVFQIVTPGTQVELDGLVIQGGLAQDDGTAGVTAGSTAAEGGGLLNSGGTATVSDCTFTSNFTSNSVGRGGGLLNNNGGTATVSGCTFTSNSAFNGGGLTNVFGTVTVSGCIFTSNSAFNGGGLTNVFGTVTVSGCTFTSNSAVGGGGLANFGTAMVSGSTFTRNSAAGNGGGISNSSNSGLLAIAGSTLSDNSAVEDGGGIFNNGGGVALAAVTIRGNSAAHGGGIFNTNGGVLAIVASDISHNSGGDLVDVT